MKRVYAKPALEISEFRFSEHIAVSGGTTSSVPVTPKCRWGKYLTDIGMNCEDNVESGWINNQA